MVWYGMVWYGTAVTAEERLVRQRGPHNSELGSLAHVRDASLHRAPEHLGVGLNLSTILKES